LSLVSIKYVGGFIFLKHTWRCSETLISYQAVSQVQTKN
jgi:hypothetical protein